MTDYRGTTRRFWFGFHTPNLWDAAAGVLLRDLRAGELVVVTPDGREHRFAGQALGPSARMVVRDHRLARRVLTGGDIALAKAYMDGFWDTPDLDAVLELGLANLKSGWVADLPVLLRPVHRVWHARRDNDPAGGSKRNIAHHYDLGNDFYRLWLDSTLTYSSAVFDEEPAASGKMPSIEDLEAAQRRKWDRILELIQPASGGRLLEIGCGWGGFAVYAAQEAGCRVTALTLSREQADLARERVRDAGLEGRVDVRFQDYREVGETFDGVASIEMFEAVGERWWPTFFARIREFLKPGRAAGIQVITIAEENFEEYRRTPDFIQRFIFPGGMLPSPERFAWAAEAAGLAVATPRFFGRHYARTLAAWAERFESVLPQVRALGYDERFVRMWRYYFAYCRAGFESSNIDVMQVRIAR